MIPLDRGCIGVALGTKKRPTESAVWGVAGEVSSSATKLVETWMACEDMKGSVRVFCRFRPLTKREEDLGDSLVLHKAHGRAKMVKQCETCQGSWLAQADAFSVELHRQNDARRFDFDAAGAFATSWMLNVDVSWPRKR